MDVEDHLHGVPSFFVCPISLQIMKDPVTISTGMTFDRDSIQKWLFTYKNITCPVTKQPLSNFLLTPNLNLLRLIKSWHSSSSSSSSTKPVEHNKKTNDDEQDLALVNLKALIEEIKQPDLQVKSLKKIRSLIQENEGNNRKTWELLDAEDHGLIFSLVASLVDSQNGDVSTNMFIDEAVSILCLLKPSDDTLKMVAENGNGRLVRSLCGIVSHYSSNPIRIQAMLLLKSIFKVVDDIYKAGIQEEFFESVAEILKDQNSKHGSVAVLDLLNEVLPFGKNKEKCVMGGCVPVLVELLAENEQRRVSEMMLVVLEKLCRKAEGRAAFLAHPMGMAVVSSTILRISHVGNQKAIGLLLWVFRFCKSGELAQEFMDVGGVAKICMLVQGGLCNSKTMEKAREIVGFHLKTWSESPCFPSCFKF